MSSSVYTPDLFEGSDTSSYLTGMLLLSWVSYTSFTNPVYSLSSATLLVVPSS